MADTAGPGSRLPTMDAELARVERVLQASLQAGDPFLTEVAGHLARAGGKRLRPALTIAAGAVAHPHGLVPEEIVRGGVAVELVHLGSLYHDDVMDEAETRRTVESVNHRWGNLVAILAGDFLLARASEIAATLGSRVAGLLATTIGQLCEGQVLELKRAFDPGRTEEEYLRSISGKTASLFAAACRMGALTAGLDDDEVEALARFGERYGMAFQVVDDVLDVVATDEQLGKPAGNDLVEGVYTLPVLYALRDGVGDELGNLLGRPLGAAEMHRARDLVRGSSGVDRALDVARSHLAGAVDALAVLPEGPGVAHLTSAARGLLGSVPA